MNATQNTNTIPVQFLKNEEAVVEIKQAADPIVKVKNQIFAEFKSVLSANEQLLRLALIEADALARQTDFPQLLFPLLATEKAQNAARWQFRQRFLLRSNWPYPLAV
jgi:hypothetical protein